MNNQTLGPLEELTQRFADYLPALTGGLLVIALGVAVGWVIKRSVIRVLIWLRLDRLGGRGGWRAALGKGDVRAAIYNLVGTFVMLLVILIFLDNALQILGLTALSRMTDALVFYLPNLGLAAVIVGVGATLANLAADRTEDLLDEEGILRARLAARVLKGFVLAVVAAIALWQLNLAREVVLSAFLVAFGSIGIAFALGVGIGTARAIQRGWEALFERKEKGEGG